MVKLTKENRGAVWTLAICLGALMALTTWASWQDAVTAHAAPQTSSVPPVITPSIVQSCSTAHFTESSETIIFPIGGNTTSLSNCTSISG